MLNKSIIDEIKNKFGDKDFTSKELFEIYQNKEPKLNESTFRWRVYNLKKSGVIESSRKGVFKLRVKDDFKPLIDNSTKEIFKEIKERYPYIDISIWETKWLTNFMLHQTFKNIIIIEVDKEAVNAIYTLLQNVREDVYLNPSRAEIEKYLNIKANCFVIKNRITEAPSKKYEDMIIPRIEKILVDLIADKQLLSSYQGNELQNIFSNILSEYSINLSTLNRYSKRRNIKKEIDAYIERIKINESLG